VVLLAASSHGCHGLLGFAPARDTSGAAGESGAGAELGQPERAADGLSDRAVVVVDAASQPQLRLSAGYYHTCVLFAGSVRCWGRNDHGQLGVGNQAPVGVAANQMGPALVAVDLGGAVAKDLGVGHFHTCVLLTTGQTRCWGEGSYGELGNESALDVGINAGETAGLLSVLKQPAGLHAQQLSVQKRNVCLIYDDHSLRCNGQNDYGQLGTGTTSNLGLKPGEMGDSLKAIQLGTGRSASAVVEGDYHTCALLDDGSVKCWGRNEYGRLGYGDTVHRGGAPGSMGDSLPAVDLGEKATALYRAYFSNCARLKSGGVKCWGANLHGELGLGDTNHRGDEQGEMGTALPVLDPGGGRTIAAVRGGFHFLCLILDDRTIKCAGYNAQGQLGRGDCGDWGGQAGQVWASLPVINLGKNGQGQPVRLRTATLESVAVGNSHVCVVLEDDRVKCWGSNTEGQLGLGDKTNRGDQPGQMGDALPAVKL